jgi:hypothetical protein
MSPGIKPPHRRGSNAAAIAEVASPPAGGHTRTLRHPADGAMRSLLALVLLTLVIVSSLMAGCTPYIPVKDDFGTSALVPAGNIPPEFVEFNAYDPAINGLLADQICATPYQPLGAQNRGAAGGRLVQADGRCQTHIPIWGD